MKKLKAFWFGIKEFRCTFLTYFANYSEQRAYERGRAVAHVLTLRRFEP